MPSFSLGEVRRHASFKAIGCAPVLMGPDVEVVALIIPAGSPINRLQLGDGTTEPGPQCQFASKLFAATISIQSVVSDVLQNYRIAGNAVHILRILHRAQKWPPGSSP
jgi:hypothetical protein